MAVTRTLALTLRYIEWHIWRFGRPPTQPELAKAFGIKDAAAYQRIRRLKKMGRVRYETDLRGLKLVYHAEHQNGVV